MSEGTSSESSTSPARTRSWLRFARPLLFVLGALALGLLVVKLGPLQVWHALRGAGAWLPLIFALDLLWLSVEGLSVLVLYGSKARSIPRLAWIEATLVHFATFMVVPVGRASAEAARAGLMARFVGKGRSLAGAFVMQSITLSANALLSIVCLLFVWWGGRSEALVGAIGLNVGITMSLGISMYLLLRHVRVGGRLGRLFPKISQAGEELDVQIRESSPRHFPALLVCLTGRTIQTVQYGVIFFAVVGLTTPLDAFSAQGIQLVSRTLGDAVPNQVGVTEGAFAASAGALLLEATPEKAVAIALLARLSNLSVAGICALSVQLFPSRSKSVEAIADQQSRSSRLSS